ncbi:hypothetical protein [Parashewanella curva]|nr:hypothetical protein [Parashewanella curva]
MLFARVNNRLDYAFMSDRCYGYQRIKKVFFGILDNEVNNIDASILTGFK